MVDHINQSIDVVVPFMDGDKNEDEDEDKKFISIFDYTANGRPLYQIKQKRYVDIIRRQLKAENRILLKAYNSFAYYSCDLYEMKQKVLEHMRSTNAYSFLMKVTKANQTGMEKYLNDMDKGINLTLNNLLKYQFITYSQWLRMRIKRSKLQFDTLYFLPDPSQRHVPFRPLLYSPQSLTYSIAHFLNQLLQPIYDRVSRSKTFNTGADVIIAMEEYIKKGLLQSNTVFATWYIDDLCTQFPHEQIIEALQRFLHNFLFDVHLQGISIPTIIQLVRLILENQYFVYERKLYKQIQGSGSNSPLTSLLANICLYYWQQDLVEILLEKNELFGRHLNQILMTWNESEDQLRTLFNLMRRQEPNLRIKLSIDDNINYLGAQLSHRNGHFNNKVAHELSTEPYSLPYVYGYSQHKDTTLVREALRHAVACSSRVTEFQHEREQIEFSFAYNGFSTDIIRHEIKLFLTEFNAEQLMSQLDHLRYDQTLYDHLRQRVLRNN